MHFIARPKPDLIEGKVTVIDIPFLHVDLAMRGICDAIDADLQFLCALLRSPFSDSFDDFLDRYDGSKDVGACCNCYDACPGGD
jgi:hypothetical protein